MHLRVCGLFFALLLAGSLNCSLAATLIVGDAQLSANEHEIVIRKESRTIVRLRSIKFNYEQALSWQITRSDSQEIVLVGRFPAAVDFYRRPLDEADRTVEVRISKEAQGYRLYAKPEWGRQVTLEMEHLGDHFFGVSEPLQPDNRLSPDLTGTSVSLEIKSEGESLHENYASAFSAFYMSTFGYGAFFDTFARGRYEFAINGANRIHHDAGTLDWHIFLGEDGREIHRAYFDLIGQPKPVPAWGLGPVGWRDHNTSAAEILADVAKMTELRIPFTSWFVDRPYSDGTHGWSQLNFSPAFANPGEWIRTLQERFGLEFMTWTTTATFGDARFAKHLAGKFTYLDLSDPESVRRYQEDLRTQQHVFGVKGHKIDRGDEGFAVYEDWRDTNVPPAERRNKYAYLMTKIHDDVLRASFGEDQITFARAAIHRTQPYLSAIWGGDPRTTWDGLRGNFANAARSSFIGFPVWGTDVGGYQGEGHIPGDLYIRWLQAGSMTGLFEIKLDGAGGEGRDRMPWRYGEAFQEMFRGICADRMRLVPYLYSLARTSGKTGTLMQPLAYRHLDDANTYDNWDQFYVGDAILVAPVFGPETRRDVYLPAGEWRDFDDATKRYRGGKTISIDAPLSKLPRFVKENSLYVSGNIYRGNDRVWDRDEARLIIHAFPAAQTGSSSFTYVDMLDGNKNKAIELTRAKREVSIEGPAMMHAVRVLVALDKVPRSVRIGTEVVEAQYDAGKALLSVDIAPNRAIDVRVAL